MRLVTSLATLWATPQLAPQRGASIRAIELPHLPAHVRYLEEVAMSVVPSGLAEVVALRTLHGEEVVEPGVDPSIHPLIVPLTRSPATGQVVGLLRWPGASGGATKLPLVRTTGQQLEMLASSAEHYITRQLVLADSSEAGDTDISQETLEALASSCGINYERGAATKSPGGIPGYLITKVGPFIQEYERLATGHVARGAEQSGLIACERSQQCFAVWGRPLAFHAQTLMELGRDEEARDLARQALEQPLWTLGA